MEPGIELMGPFNADCFLFIQILQVFPAVFFQGIKGQMTLQVIDKQEEWLLPFSAFQPRSDIVVDEKASLVPSPYGQIPQTANLRLFIKLKPSSQSCALVAEPGIAVKTSGIIA